MKLIKVLIVLFILIISVCGCENKADAPDNIVDDVVLQNDYLEDIDEQSIPVDDKKENLDEDSISTTNNNQESEELEDQKDIQNTTTNIEKSTHTFAGDKTYTSYSIDLKDDPYGYLSMNVIDDYVYIARDNYDDKMVQIYGIDVTDLENNPLKKIYEGNGEKNYSTGYTGCFYKSKDNEVVCNLQQQLIYIDPVSHEVIRSEDIESDIIDYRLSHDGKTESYTKDNYNIYINSKKLGEKLIEEGDYIDETIGAGCGYYVYIPQSPRWSTDDNYMAYLIGEYESSSGPTIIDSKGNTLLNCNLEICNLCWLSDNQLMIENFFGGPYLAIIDIDKYNYWYLVKEQDMSFEYTYNPDTHTLSIFKDKPYNHLRIFDTNNLNKYLEVPIDKEIYNGQYIFPIKDKIYIINYRDDKLNIDIYPFEGEEKIFEPEIHNCSDIEYKQEN
ncbi:hypothetical protein SH1V18_07530 [Vallitalea longa]|uniref:DUF5050 domain-containing protein n=1 Tax=Vallitalea longa TaxID=2936439 RepID=A0A9W5YBL0_9FIRM|nr:hypothetical protein [Vallitalea longa]GKX28273.1 hypothetical protein SH1V18_07530 [Vallitalea longa]